MCSPFLVVVQKEESSDCRWMWQHLLLLLLHYCNHRRRAGAIDDQIPFVCVVFFSLDATLYTHFPGTVYFLGVVAAHHDDGGNTLII